MLVRLKSPDGSKSLVKCKQAALDKKAEGGATEEVLQALSMLEPYNGETEISVSTLRAALVVYTSLLASNKEEASRLFWEEVILEAKPTYPELEKRKQEKEERLKGKEEWRKSLRVKDQERKYNHMISNVAWGGPRDKDIETRGMYQTSMGLNMVAAAATVGFVLYYSLRGIFPQESIRVCVATVGGFAMMMIELILYMIRSHEAQEFEAKRERNERLGRIGKPLPVPPPQPLFTAGWWGGRKDTSSDKDKVKNE